MTYNLAYLEAKVLSQMGEWRARNYPLWIALQKINKIGLVDVS